ncbi:type II toxin-antitoxin system RelE/ParE family toxin [Novosphingobium sp.]|uniref:type II toxin-antitoxin system RelE/ParE family toxin n=1 Tax=Novosphingobium sp. TaxID=1874826 RepID=UPI0025CBF1AC|nr:type II toxin-antitoxin system RelE/ParE family toxin [Novosphingobium sp.]
MTDNLDSPRNVLYTGHTFSLEETLEFAKWLNKEPDRKGRAMIVDRLRRAANGNFGTIRSVHGGVFEMKIDHGPGYRVYYFQRGKQLVILLCGGDKRTQKADIAYARRLKEEIERRGGDKAL